MKPPAEWCAFGKRDNMNEIEFEIEAPVKDWTLCYVVNYTKNFETDVVTDLLITTSEKEKDDWFERIEAEAIKRRQHIEYYPGGAIHISNEEGYVLSDVIMIPVINIVDRI